MEFVTVALLGEMGVFGKLDPKLLICHCFAEFLLFGAFFWCSYRRWSLLAGSTPNPMSCHSYLPRISALMRVSWLTTLLGMERKQLLSLAGKIFVSVEPCVITSCFYYC